LRETDALDALDLGARRIDFLALHFQIADQVAAGYVKLYDGVQNPAISAHVSRDLWNLSGVNGLCEDLRDGYHYLGTRYSEVWLRENRPFWLDNVSARYDAAANLWVERSAKLASARDQWSQTHVLPTPAEMGIPQAPPAGSAK
jgi:hexosaminidase